MSTLKTDFERAAQTKRSTIVGEFVHFLKSTKKWWLLPILTVLALIALLAFVGSTGAGPFVYTIF